MVLVTGRIASELRAVFPDALDHVDAIVAENGAVLATRAGVRLLAAPVGRAVSAWLAARGVPHRAGQVLVACATADEPAASEVIRELGLDCRLVRNRGELMIVPAGVTKGTGLIEVLDDMGLSRHNAIGVGDAENDHSLLHACEVGVAVANAVDAIRSHADAVLSLPDGQGVAVLLPPACPPPQAYPGRRNPAPRPSRPSPGRRGGPDRRTGRCPRTRRPRPSRPVPSGPGPATKSRTPAP